jgi:predicted O-methyltransferase YrrM
MARLLEHVQRDPRLRRAAGIAARATYRTPAPMVAGRWEFPRLLNRRRLTGLAFEIGVRDGGFSELLLRAWRGRLLVSVDPWGELGEDGLYARTCERLAPFGGRSEVWRTTSVAASARVLPASADFVYIDALHDHDSALEDVSHWYDKVRPGGIIAGHDYVDGTFPEGEFGVRSAVDGFFGARGVAVRATLLDPPWRSWWVEAPLAG